MLDVSIIYVNYKTNQLLYNSINSVIKNTLLCDYEIIVVDNSNDIGIFSDLQHRLKEFDRPIKLIDAKGNIGFGNANNLGQKYSEGTNLLFLNTDTILLNDTISILNDFLKSNDDFGIVGPNIFDLKERPYHSFVYLEKNISNQINRKQLVITGLKKLFGKRTDFNYNNHFLEIYGYICGACLMIRNNLFVELGGFDKDIFMYSEENLLCYRLIHELNFKIANVPEARIIHLEGQSFSEISGARYNMMADGNYLYLKKAFGEEIAERYFKNEIKKDYLMYYIWKFLNRKKSLYYLNSAKAYEKRLINTE